MINDYAATFVTIWISAFAGMKVVIGYAESYGDEITQLIIVTLAGAVGILWKRLDSHYKKVEAELSGAKLKLAKCEENMDECEKDRSAIKAELNILKEMIQPEIKVQPIGEFDASIRKRDS